MNIKKSIFAFALLFVGLSTTEVSAQNADAKLTYTQVVDKSADDVWTILRQLDNIAEYSSGIAKVDFTGNKGVGGVRVCHAPDGKGKFKEEFTGFDDTNRTLTYAVTEGVPIKGMVNNWKVVDLGYNKCMVVYWSNYEAFMENPQMTEEQFMGFISMSVKEMITNMGAGA